MLLVCALLAGGCATAPNADLDRARVRYEAVSQDANIAKYASVALYEAKKDLERAEAEWQKGDDQAEVSHLAGMAEIRMSIAQANADTGLARAESQALFEQREKLQLDARTVAAERAAARASQAEKALAELQGERTKEGVVLNFAGDVLFEVNEAVISIGARDTLNRVAAFLRDNPDREIFVGGHTDSTGEDSYNMALSQRRADAVANYLMSGGVAGNRVVARGFGESVPVASNDNAAGRQRNRRVVVVILNPGEKAANYSGR